MGSRIFTRRHFLQDAFALASLGLLNGCGQSLPWQQQVRIPRIGYLALRPAGPQPSDALFRQGLRDLGYVEEQTIVVEWRWAERTEQLPGFASELVALDVDLVVSTVSTATQLLKQASTTIPIVMNHGGDPVGAGLVASLGRPGGNVTGVGVVVEQLAGRRLQLLREAIPQLTSLGVLWNPGSSAKPLDYRELQGAATALGVRLVSFEVRDLPALDVVLHAAAAEQVDALAILSDPVTSSGRTRIADFAMAQRLPTLSETRTFAEAGILMAYGPSDLERYQRAAVYVDKILKGARPADLPVEQPIKFDFVVNLKTAQAMGLIIPGSTLAQATEVIQ